MKTIEVDEELYRYIASQTQHIGESASEILRRLLQIPLTPSPVMNEAIMPSKRAIVIAKDADPIGFTDKVREMRSLLISDEFANYGSAVSRFMLILSTLYQLDKQLFSEAAGVKGRTRVYFADNERTLLASGKTTKPRHIDGSPYWVITNTNTNRKRQIVQQVMEKMGFEIDITDKVIAAI